MAKEKTVWACDACGKEYPKFQGRCFACNGTSLSEVVQKITKNTRYAGYSSHQSKLVPITKVDQNTFVRENTGFGELDRVLGGGIVPGSIILIGGDPGIGKSTLLLQLAAKKAVGGNQVIYNSGEESPQQIALRGERLDCSKDDILLIAESNVDNIMELVEEKKPSMLIIDSIQTMYSDGSQSSAGSVVQIKECTSQIARVAKRMGLTTLIVCHVTKSGELAGPKVLEHIVDTVLYFEGDENYNFRLLRTQKNRFGTVNEVGVFQMTEQGLEDVKDPSSVFLGQDRTPVPGSAITVAQEGTRSIIVEIQSLVDISKQPIPRRLGIGVDNQRLSMILAVISKVCSVKTYDSDIFTNVVGGLKLTEPSADLSIMLSILSSITDKPLPKDLCVLGEIDLTGKIRPINRVNERIKEAVKLGFKIAIIPEGNQPKQDLGLKVYPVKNVKDVLNLLVKLKDEK